MVIITRFPHQRYGKDMEQILANWQKKGTHFIILSGKMFPKLQGKAVKAPVKFMLPEMKKVAKKYRF